MIPFSKNRIILWMLIFLIGVNISMFITLIVLFSKNSSESTVAPAINVGNTLSKSLSLSKTQTEKVDMILADYKRSTDTLIVDIRNHRIQILEEVAREKPDTTKLNSLMAEIALLQKQMQNASVDQYLALKEICTPDQCKRLSALYYELYGYQFNNDNGQENKRQHRHRGGRN